LQMRVFNLSLSGKGEDSKVRGGEGLRKKKGFYIESLLIKERRKPPKGSGIDDARD